MTITEKYNFKVSVDQFHTPVDEHYQDAVELPLIEIFEQQALLLKEQQKESYSMIELGSNQCYYSLLFKHILGKDKTYNIMVEPYAPNLAIGKSQFELNNCKGCFYNRGIGQRWEAVGRTFDVMSITLNEILCEQKLRSVDVLHCDIDGSEAALIDHNNFFFNQKKAGVVFLLTHSVDIHTQCKDFFRDNTPYTLIHEVSEPNIGWDRLLIYK